MQIGDRGPARQASKRFQTISQAARRSVSQGLARVSETVLSSETLEQIREGRVWRQWVDSLTPEALDDLSAAPAEQKRRVFRANVRLVEIETHAKCNRNCSFCPNFLMDRRRNSQVTDAGMLRRLFEELGSIDYDGQIKVARYSEPLTNIQYLCEQIALARRLVPRARLAIVTNTDYLTRDILSRLQSVGLDIVYMSLYLKTNETWTPELAREYSRRLAAKLGTRISHQRETSFSVECTYAYDGLVLTSACRNFDTYGTDRGAIMEQYTSQSRRSPCREPFETFVVDHTGAVMPCCNLRSDLPVHKEYIAGDLTSGASIFDIYADTLAGWRRAMVGFGVQGSPCTTCKHRAVPAQLSASIAERLEQRLVQIDRSEYYKPPTDS